jgi:hypothetical protein
MSFGAGEREPFPVSIQTSEIKQRLNADSTTANTKYQGAPAPADLDNCLSRDDLGSAKPLQ